MTKENLIQRLQVIGVIQKEKVTLRSGVTSDFYCNMKKAFGDPDVLNALADEIGRVLPTSTTCIAAGGHGGLPLAAVVASRFNLNYTGVRSAAKDHGKSDLIDGHIPTSSDVVVIIDDVLTSGSSIRDTLAVLENSGVTVDRAVVLVKRGDPKLSIPYSYIFTVNEILGN